VSASNGIRKVCFAALRCGFADVFDGTAHSQRKKNSMYLAISYDDFMLAIIHTENTYITSGLQIFYEFVWDRLVAVLSLVCCRVALLCLVLQEMQNALCYI
jgi:hypothetical protein